MIDQDTPDVAMNDLFHLADKLRRLRAVKDDFTAMIKDINIEIDSVEQELLEAMSNAECPSFTRGDKQFILTTTTRWSAEIERKDDLYAALKVHGYDHLFTVNTQTLGSFVREQVNETTDENGQTHVPGWLAGLVKSYDDVGVTMKSATRRPNG